MRGMMSVCPLSAWSTGNPISSGEGKRQTGKERKIERERRIGRNEGVGRETERKQEKMNICKDKGRMKILESYKEERGQERKEGRRI